MNELIVVSDAAQISAVRRMLGENQEVISWDAEINPASFKGREVLLWLNRTEGYRGDVEVLSRLFLKHASVVHELVNEQEGEGYCPTEAEVFQMTCTNFAEWSSKRKRKCITQSFRSIEETKPQGEFMHGAGSEAEQFEQWVKLGLTLTKGKNATAIANESNVVKILQGYEHINATIWLDEFALKPMLTVDGSTRPWTDSDSGLLLIELQDKLGLVHLKKSTVDAAMLAVAMQNKRHPVKEWLTGIVWDGKPRLDHFFRDYMSAEDTPFNVAASRNFFLSSIARVYRPGCQVDFAIVLEGAQGAGKSSALRTLFGQWYSSCNEPVSSGSNKDFFALLRGKMCVEIAEMDSFSKAEVTKIKNIMSTAVDEYRSPYDRFVQAHPRTSIFTLTTNEDTYLSDVTGGRRSIPVAIGYIHLENITRDRDQLFAEAMVEFRNNKPWWDFPDADAKAIQESRRRTDPWEPLIYSYLLDKSASQATVSEIALGCLEITPAAYGKRDQMRIAACLKALGWVHAGKATINGHRETVWVKSHLVLPVSDHKFLVKH